MINANEDLLDIKLVAGLVSSLEADFNINSINIDNLISDLLAIEFDKTQPSKKKECESHELNAAKLANLLEEILEYIYVAKYRRSPTLAWYNNMIYAYTNNELGAIATKVIFQLCCNKPSCQSRKPDLIYKNCLIDNSIA